MRGTDSGLRFWLSYVEHRGGLVDAVPGGALAVLPEPLQAQLGLPETVSVTGDPEVAREDGALLLAAGHPALALSAGAVLAQGDVGRLALAWPGDQLPAAADLLERARDAFPVDHGRIDPADPPVRSYLPVLRAGAMIRYVVAGDEAFQERAECWLDAGARRELPEAVRSVLESGSVAAVASAGPGLPASGPGSGSQGSMAALPDSAPVLPFDLDGAVDAAHQALRGRAGRRLAALEEDGRHAQAAEIGRTEAYYRDVLAGIERRRAGTAAERVAALDARAEATRQERARRLAEIRDKHQARFELTPYRLQVLLVPAVVLPVDVMRGSRRYPQRLVWIWTARCFRPLPCPSCGSERRLVAGKTGLGCEACLLPRAEPPAPAATPAATPPVATVPAPAGPHRPAAAPVTKAPVTKAPVTKAPVTTAPVTTAPVTTAPPSPGRVRALGDKLVTSFWQSVSDDDQRLAKQLLPDSPAATARRLFGVRGLVVPVGVPLSARLISVSGGSRGSGHGDRYVSQGVLATRPDGEYPFALIWRPQGERAVVEEILPAATHDPSRLRGWWFGCGPVRFTRLPGRPGALDAVAARLTDVVLPHEGLPLLLRCLTAWWRIDAAPLIDVLEPAVMAAALLRMVSWRAGVRVPAADCADRFQVRVEHVKAAETQLKPRLRLSAEVVW